MLILSSLAAAAAAPPTGPVLAAPLTAGIVLGAAIAVDWHCPGPDLWRDRFAFPLAVAGLAGLAEAIGWHTWCRHLITAPASRTFSDSLSAVALVIVLGVLLATGVSMCRPRRTGKAREAERRAWARLRDMNFPRVNPLLWAAAVTVVIAAPLCPQVPWLVLAVGERALLAPFVLLAPSVARHSSPALAWGTTVVSVVAWLVTFGWRPHKIIIPSPEAGRSLLSWAKALVRADSDSDSDSERSRPVATGRDRLRAVADPAGPETIVRIADGVTSGRPADAFVRVGHAVRWEWPVWWARMWAGVPRRAVADPTAPPRPKTNDRLTWIAQSLATGARPVDVVREGVATWRTSERTMWRHMAKVTTPPETGRPTGTTGRGGRS